MPRAFSMAEIVAETDRLILRTEAIGDVDRWMEVMNTPAVMRHLGGVCERHEVEARFAKKAAGIAKFGYGFWHLQTKADGLLIGQCGLGPIDVEAAGPVLNAGTQIGWSIAESHWRQGFASEAARAAIDLAFNRFGIDQLYAQTSNANRASWAMMEKLGMTRAAELDYVDPDYPPEENPTIIYHLTSALWEQSFV
jgi:RimJ/RimL family protein N-acetyltransferase